ncbi:MAG: serine/threonine protein kinase [Rhodopirellula sp.]|nr:serine/threonine protein kinase [Rhodopirellula sp.]
MSDENLCPQCGAGLPAQSPQGLCPGCLLKWGLESQSGGEETGSQPAAADRPPPTPGEIAAYFPELEILELVGRGGMGVVYKARQKRLDRLVALKILAPKIGQDPAFAERFAREARAMAILSHPHVVAVYDFGQTDGLYYFLMEFVDGVNLRRLLDTGKLAPEEALAIVPQICEALQYAHDHGVVHRDIKPENVLLDKEGRVKIADFGIAKLVGKEAKDLTLTGAGQIIGTPQYMAPEQIEHPLQVDHRADIYSLGVVFYQMLTGELPMGRFAPPSKKVQIDVRLDEIVLRALEKEPERRYQQASDIKTHIETLSSPMTSGAGERLSADRSAGTYESGSSAAPTNWLAWLAQATFRSPEVVAIYNHMTVAERREQATRQGVVGVVLFALLVAPGFVSLASTIAGVFVFVAAVAALSILVGQWRKLLKQHLCSTAWSREQGLTPDRLRLTILDPPLRTGQPHARKQAGPSAPARAGADVASDEVQRNVRGPAIGVLVIGILNWLIAVPLCLTFLWWGGSYSPHPLPSGRKVASELDPASVFWASSSTLMMICLLAILVISSLMIFAALKMKRLQAYWLAVAASILAIIISPGNLIGLPIGIWSLVVLGQREVRAAFARHRARPAGTPEAGDSEGVFGAPQVAVQRLSKTALAGSIWAGPFFLVIVVSLCVITLWMTLSLSLLFPLLSPFLLLLLAAPIGVTILGYVALKQIRRSAGLLYGLELAVFDLLAFPLLALDAVIAGFGIFAARALIGGLGGAATLFFIVVACVVVDVLVVRWGWRAVNRRRAGALPVERPKRGGLKTKLSVAAPVLMFCLGVFGFAFLLWSVTERIENARARIHTRIFEADAKLVDELVLRPTRQPAHSHDSALEIPSRDPQTAQVNAAVFARLLADGANPPGLLDDQTREGNWWPKQATSSHYFRRGKIAGDGYVDGFLGIWRQKDVRQLWAEFNGLHGMNSELRVVKVVWEGKVPPPEAARAFFIPFSRTDGTARYLVIALEVGDGAENEEGISKPTAELGESQESSAILLRLAQRETSKEPQMTPARQHTEPPLQFGPVIEQVMKAVSEGRGGGGVDLASGKVIDVPQEFTGWAAERQGEWCEEKHVDLVFDFGIGTGPFYGGSGVLSLMAPESLRLARCSAELWQGVTSESMHEAIAKAKSIWPIRKELATMVKRSGETLYTAGYPSELVTFAFQTHTGDIGLLQILGCTEAPLSTRIRYKLVQPDEKAPTPQ